MSSEKETFDNPLPAKVAAPQPPAAPQKTPSRFMTFITNTGNQIPIAVVFAMGLGVFLNEVIGPKNIPKEVSVLIGAPGDWWLACLKSIVIPLILSSIVQAVQGMKKMPGGGGKIAKIGIAYFFISTFVAMGIAAAMCYIIMVPNLKPIDLSKLADQVADATKEVVDSKQVTLVERLVQTVTQLVPANPVKAMADTDLLAVLVMGIVIGGLINDSPEKPSIIIKFLKELDYLVTIIVTFLVKLSPVGIFSLILPPLMQNKISDMMSFLSWFLITLIVSLLIHYFVYYPVVHTILMRQNGYSFLKSMTPAALTAMGVASSAASMPTMFKCCHSVGIHPDIYRFMIPLGVTIHADGAAILFMCSVFFMVYGAGSSIGMADLLVVFLTDFLACLGSPPIPAAGLMFMMMMLRAINQPVTAMFSLVAAFDWLTHRPSTALNVVGDAFGCALAQKYGMGIDVDPSVNINRDMEDQPVEEVVTTHEKSQ